MDEYEELPKMAGWHEAKLAVPEAQLQFASLKPNYNITFHKNSGVNNLGEKVGSLDFNGSELKFEGDAEESAKVFIDWISHAFKGRLEEEYKRGYSDAKEGKDLQR